MRNDAIEVAFRASVQQPRPLSAWAMATPASLAFGSSMLLGSVVRLEPVHDLLLVELGAHVEHGAGEAAHDFGDLL